MNRVTGYVSAVRRHHIPHSPPMNSDHMLLVELDNSIVGAARKVLATLKPGLNETAYEKALLIEDESVRARRLLCASVK